jgi:hypothetical protein
MFDYYLYSYIKTVPVNSNIITSELVEINRHF